MKDDSLERAVRADQRKKRKVRQEDREMVNHNLLFDFDIGVFFILHEKVFKSGVQAVDGVDYLVVQRT